MTKCHRNYSSAWKLHNIVLNNHQITKEIRDEIKKFLKSNENGSTIKYMGNNESSIKKELF